ncbi:acyl carrier protein [Nocardiopsis ansamitocini]|uniref:Carrier domain-containing protein n=1 Tax=Nocardiopsis ansamitocini TaxID=1670832 RepID=A0A9W6UIZ6_9ACTN|nr:acyl carrier protein [Nocardiopsis ansamitocini]GLU48212.1 hypothetical protein Nans01_25630 [Nocardiopsis ansamitocini]
MGETDIREILLDYLTKEVIESPGARVRPDTALLELGILNSLSTMRLTSFIHRRFEVEIPLEDMVGRNFKDVNSISRLVAGLLEGSSEQG